LKRRIQIMAKIDNEKEAAATTAAETQAKSAERKFGLASLRTNCVRLFGCTSSTFDGAFYGTAEDQKYTIAEAKETINKWLGKGVGK
jgi:hypothetical protein